MKNTLFILLLNLLAFVALGQEYDERKGFSVYLEAGLDNSNLLDAGKSVGSSLTIPYGGIGLETPGLFSGRDTSRFPRQINISLSALFAGRGTDYNNPTFKQRFFYADFPVRLNTPVFNGLDAYLGLKPSYLISTERTKLELYDTVPIRDAKDLTLSVGGGISLPLSDKVDVGLEYWHNISKISQDYKHSWIRFSIKLNLQQTYDDITSKSREDSFRLAEAQNHIQNLKNGALLVRLPSKHNTIQSLEQKGKYWEAAKTEAQNRSKNQTIREAFRENYNFSEVYFFYDTSTNAVRNGEFRGHLLDEHDRPVWRPNPVDFYIADIGDTYLENAKGMFNGLVIRDKTLNMLPEPFPNKLEGHGSLQAFDLDRSPAVLVNKLNTELWEFFNEHFGEEDY